MYLGCQSLIKPPLSKGLFKGRLNKGTRKMEGISESVYYASGFGGNYIVIDQENQLVIVTRWLEPSKLGEFLRLVNSSLK